jgi:hypothetical protein
MTKGGSKGKQMMVKNGNDQRALNYEISGEGQKKEGQIIHKMAKNENRKQDVSIEGNDCTWKRRTPYLTLGTAQRQSGRPAPAGEQQNIQGRDVDREQQRLVTDRNPTEFGSCGRRRKGSKGSTKAAATRRKNNMHVRDTIEVRTEDR